MKYAIGDRFLLGLVEVEIVYINRGKAWLAPLEDEDLAEGVKVFRGLAMTNINAQGQLPDGSTIVSLPLKKDCAAV